MVIFGVILTSMLIGVGVSVMSFLNSIVEADRLPRVGKRKSYFSAIVTCDYMVVARISFSSLCLG